MNRTGIRSSISCLLALGAALVGSSYVPAMAGYEVLPGGNGIRIKGTGFNLPANGGVDPNWTIKAFPNNLVASPNIYIPATTASSWYDGVTGDNNNFNNAISFSGDPNTYRWSTYATYPNSANTSGITKTPGQQDAESYFGPSTTVASRNNFELTSNYTYVLSTSFTLDKSSTYSFSYNTTADNRVQVYIGGCLTGAGTQTPGIDVSPSCASGGYFVAENLANTGGQFRNLLSGTTTLELNAGTYDLNYVITDNYNVGPSTFGQTGFLIGSSAFTEVPAPLPIVGAGVFFSYSRKLRRRIGVPKA